MRRYIGFVKSGVRDVGVLRKRQSHTLHLRHNVRAGAAELSMSIDRVELSYRYALAGNLGNQLAGDIG